MHPSSESATIFGLWGACRPPTDRKKLKSLEKNITRARVLNEGGFETASPIQAFRPSLRPIGFWGFRTL